MSMFNRSFLSCELIGNLGQEPKSVQTKTGKPMATFTVAVTTSVKDADGNWSNQTQWVRRLCRTRTQSPPQGDDGARQG